MMRKRVACAVLVAAALAARTAEGDPILHVKTPSTLTTDGGSTRRLPPGYFLDEEKWATKDAEKKQAENDRTRLTAENESLRKSAQELSFGWKTLAVVVVIGAAAGFAAAQLQ